jgi:hypothetical protein
MIRLHGGVLPALLLALTLLATESRADAVSACGWIVRESGCLRFQNLEEPGNDILPDSLDLNSLGIYHVTGVRYNAPPTCGDFYYSTHLRDVVIEPCIPDTFGCGRIFLYTEEYTCHVWRALAEDRTFVLGDLFGFAVGDTVMAVGIECRTCQPVPGTCAEYGWLWQMQLTACPHALNPVLQTSWGQVKVRYR